MNSDSDLRSYRKAIAQITNKPLFGPEIAQGLNDCSHTHTHTLVALRFSWTKTKYHGDYLRDEIQDEMATEQLSLSAFFESTT